MRSCARRGTAVDLVLARPGRTGPRSSSPPSGGVGRRSSGRRPPPSARPGPASASLEAAGVGDHHARRGGRHPRALPLQVLRPAASSPGARPSPPATTRSSTAGRWWPPSSGSRSPTWPPRWWPADSPSSWPSSRSLYRAAVVVEAPYSRLFKLEHVTVGFVPDLLARVQVRYPSVPIVLLRHPSPRRAVDVPLPRRRARPSGRPTRRPGKRRDILDRTTRRLPLALIGNELLPRRRPGAGRHLRRRHRHQPPTPGAHGRRLRRARARGLQRDPGRHPARRHRRPARARSSRSASTWSRPTPSGRSSITLAEYGIAERAYELNVAGGPRSPGRWPTASPRPTPAVGGRLDRPRHQVPLPRPDPLRRAARRLRGPGPGPARRRRRPPPRRDRLRPAPGQGRHHRLPAGHGRGRPRGAHPGPGHHRAHRPHAARHRDRRRPHRPRRPCGPTSSGSTAPPARPRCTSTCATCPSTAGCRSRACPTPACPSVVDGKMHYDLTPDQLAEYHARFVTELGVSVVGGCCGTTPEHLRPSSSAAATSRPRPATPVHEPGAASIYTRVPFDQDTSFLVVGERTNANGSQEVPRRHAGRRLGHAAWPWPRTR